MNPAAFDYYRASSVKEALELLKEHDGAKLLAGGHSLLPLLKLRLSAVPALIDIGRIDTLKGIRQQGDTLHIGAMTTHAALETSEEVPAAVRDAARVIGDPAVRARGTVGGSLAHADPAADWPTVFLALDATLHAEGPEGARTIPVSEFFTSIFETALAESEILTGLELSLAANRASAYVKLPDPASRYAIIGCAAALEIENGRCQTARVAVGGLLPNAQRCPSVEAALVDTSLDDDAIARAAQTLSEDIDTDDVMGDLYSSAEYRLGVAPSIIQRALTQAASRG